MLGLKPEEEIAHVCVSLPLEPVSATRLVVALQRGSQVLAQSLQTGRCVLPLVDVSGRSRQSVVKDNAITDERNRSSADNNAAGDASNAEPLLLTITLLDRPTLVEDLTEEVAAPEPSGRTTGGASGSGGGGNSSNSGGNNSKNSKRGKSGVVRKKLDANQLKIVVWTKVSSGDCVVLVAKLRIELIWIYTQTKLLLVLSVAKDCFFFPLSFPPSTF